MDLRQIFATNLRRFRHEKGLSQEELADLADINRTYISKLETGTSWAGLELIGKLAKVLTRPAADFLIPQKSRSKQ
jgi:transcriptional regulator with XRE-family HTH domain